MSNFKIGRRELVENDVPGTDPAPDINSRTGISFFQRGTNEINLIAMHNIINY